ncbi:hypothetical protein BDY24DRAFT_400850 [Mrakia frigida]|uniref:uncharacterized protein n=1 Tax=Mrakia frigida TaxID=29902 RepID=UPI003FCC0B15
MSVVASLAVLSLAASASALTLSASCIATLTTTLTTPPASECFATESLLKFLPLAITSPNTSVVATVDNYLSQVCPAPICSNETVLATATALEGGCGEVFASYGIKNESINAWVPFLPQIKAVACVQTSNATEAYNYTWTGGSNGASAPTSTNLTSNSSSSSNSSSYCLSSTLATLEKISGKNLTFSVISSIMSGDMTLSSFINTTAVQNSTALLCTDCTKGLYTSLIALGNSSSFMTATNTSIVSSVTEFVTEICGAEFINATAPSTITNGSNPDAVPSAVAATTGAASGVFSLSPLAGVLALAGAVGAFLV